jgi:hypothetical protein
MEQGGHTLYIDPSYTGTGLFLIDTVTPSFRFDLIAPPHGTMRTYENYFWTARAVEDQLIAYLDTHRPSVVKLEIPPPFGQTSAGLTGLSYLLLASILRGPGLERVELITPQFISNAQRKYFSVHTKRSYIAQEFLLRQKRAGREVLTENEALLEDNDVATAYLFYIFEKIVEGAKPFPVLRAK